MVALVALALLSWGCGPGDADVDRWKQQGDVDRLAQVLAERSHEVGLRVRAALALITMEPIRGRNIGLHAMFDTLAELPEEQLRRVLSQLSRELIRGLRQPPPARAADPSFRFKDAIYLILTHDELANALAADGKQNLEEAAVEWAMADFDRRLENESQEYGLEVLLRLIGPDAAAGLPQLMTSDAKNLIKMAELVAKLGDGPTKEEASKKLVAIAEHISSEQWRKDKEPELAEANHRGGWEPTKEQFNKQMILFQLENLGRAFAAMKRVGGGAATEYCFEVAGNGKRSVKKRQMALAALEGNIKRDSSAHIDKLLAIASNEDTADEALDQAFLRVRELPRDKVSNRLYDLFETERWKVRWAAATTVLQMSQVQHLGEFLDRLGTHGTTNFALPEAITYGARIGELRGGDVRSAITGHLEEGPVQARLSAISYYYAFGTEDDLRHLERFEDDTEAVPSCPHEADCRWECQGEAGGTAAGGAMVPIRTVGAFVKHCVIPQVKRNKPQPFSTRVGPPVPSDLVLMGLDSRPMFADEDKGSVIVGEATTSQGTVANASAVVARMHERFRHCYQQGLSQNAYLEGSVVLTIKVGPNGGVTGVGGGARSDLAPIMACLKAVVESAWFAPPEGGTWAIISVPISFER